jgi:hypothetical protein
MTEEEWREKRRAYMKAYCQTSKYKSCQKTFYQNPENKARIKARAKAWYQNPENKARALARAKARQKIISQTPKYKDYRKAYRQKPENKSRIRARKKIFRQTPKHKDWQKAYNQKPERKEWARIYRKTDKYKNSCSYIAGGLGLTASILRKHPELLEAKREQLKIHRNLKQCTRTPATYQKSATISRKPLTPHGLTSLLSLELSSWSMPWVRQLTQLLLNSKPQN